MEKRMELPDGADIHLDHSAGSGESSSGRVLFVHALGMDLTNWDDVRAGLPASVESIAIDVRGHGKSSAGALPLTLAQAADDIAVVLSQIGWDTAMIAGCSMGGCVALSLAERHPSRIAGLALVDTTAWYGPDAPQKWAERAEKAEREGFESLMSFQKQRWFSEDFRAQRPEVYERCKAVFLKNDITTYRAACTMLGQADFRSALPRFDFPAAIFVGEDDYATPVDMARYLVENLPDATLTIIPGARHFTPHETPQVLADGIAELLEHRIR